MNCEYLAIDRGNRRPIDRNKARLLLGSGIPVVVYTPDGGVVAQKLDKVTYSIRWDNSGGHKELHTGQSGTVLQEAEKVTVHIAAGISPERYVKRNVRIA